LGGGGVWLRGRVSGRRARGRPALVWVFGAVGRYSGKSRLDSSASPWFNRLVPALYMGTSTDVFVGANQTRTILMGGNLGTFYPPPYWAVFIFPARFEFFNAQGWDLTLVETSNVSHPQNSQIPMLRYTVKNNLNQGTWFERVAIRVT
jgi:hypothetical protein